VPPGAPPPAKRNWLPWALGCGCGGLILLAVLFFGAIGYIGASKERAARGAGTDTTQVSGPDSATDAAFTDSADAGDDASSTDAAGKPSDKPADGSGEPDERGLREIRPVDDDSTF